MGDGADFGELSRFERARALVITWKDGAQEEFRRQATDLAEQLKKQQNTKVETFEIESAEASDLTHDRLTDFRKEHKGKGALLIIYYGGHAAVNKDEELIWLSEKPPGKNKPWNHLPQVNWNALQKALFFQDRLSHVLFLLDCCYAGASAPSTPAAGIVESVVAVGFENVAPLQGKDSFTAALTKLLIECQKKGDSFYASRLSTVLNAELRLGERGEQNEKRIRRTPHHMDFHGTKSKIWIGALERPKEVQGGGPTAPKSTLMPDFPVDAPEKPSFIRLFQLQFQTLAGMNTHGDLVKYNRDNCFPKISFNAVWVMGMEEECTEKLMVRSLAKEQHTPWSRTLAASAREWVDILERATLKVYPNSGSDTLPLTTAEQKAYYKEVKIQPSLDRSLKGLSGSFRSRSSSSKNRSGTSALDSLRSRIWIRDLCVLQNSPADRSGQARLTAEIFGKADSFIILDWLHESTTDTICLMEFMHQLNEDAHFIDRVVHTQPHLVKEETQDCPLQTVVQCWLTLVNLLEASPLQYRRVIVGLVLCKSCLLHVPNHYAPFPHTGTMIDSQDFFGAVTLLGSRYEQLTGRMRDEVVQASDRPPSQWEGTQLPDIRNLVAYKALSAVNSFRLRTWALDLETLVCHIPALRVTDPRDIIYDFLPLAKDCEAWIIDYSAPVANIYQDFVRHCVTQSKCLDIICRPWAPRDTSNGLDSMPSWICRVEDTQEATHGSSPHRFVGKPGKRLYRVSGDSRAAAVFQYLEPPTCMTCSGFVFGRIDTLYVVSTNGILPRPWLNVAGEVGTECALWRLLVADRGPDGAPAPRWYRSAYSYWEWQHKAHDLNDIDRHKFDGEIEDVWAKGYQQTWPPSTALQYQKQARTVILNRRLFLIRWTPSLPGSSMEDLVNVYGLCPEQTEADDCVCILYGCNVPVILRRRTTTGYTLIGECFVLNFMDGEAMEIGKAKDGGEEFDIY